MKSRSLIGKGTFHFFAYDKFIMPREIWMSQICHAHNCRAVQKNETHPIGKGAREPAGPFIAPQARDPQGYAATQARSTIRRLGSGVPLRSPVESTLYHALSPLAWVLCSLCRANTR